MRNNVYFRAVIYGSIAGLIAFALGIACFPVSYSLCMNAEPRSGEWPLFAVPSMILFLWLGAEPLVARLFRRGVEGEVAEPLLRAEQIAGKLLGTVFAVWGVLAALLCTVSGYLGARPVTSYMGMALMALLYLGGAVILFTVHNAIYTRGIQTWCGPMTSERLQKRAKLLKKCLHASAVFLAVTILVCLTLGYYTPERFTPFYSTVWQEREYLRQHVESFEVKEGSYAARRGVPVGEYTVTRGELEGAFSLKLPTMPFPVDEEGNVQRKYDMGNGFHCYIDAESPDRMYRHVDVWYETAEGNQIPLVVRTHEHDTVGFRHGDVVSFGDFYVVNLRYGELRWPAYADSFRLAFNRTQGDRIAFGTYATYDYSPLALALFYTALFADLVAVGIVCRRRKGDGIRLTD